MRLFFCLLFFAPSSVFAAVDFTTQGQLAISKLAERSLKKDLRLTKIKKMRIDWSSAAAQCLKVQNEMRPEEPLAVCHLPVSAEQVEAQVAVVQTAKGCAVSVIYANLE